MADFKAYILTFGGVAVDPLSDAARELLSGFEGEDSIMRYPDSCMAGLPKTAIGFEPHFIPELIEMIKEAGLTSQDG